MLHHVGVHRLVALRRFERDLLMEVGSTSSTTDAGPQGQLRGCRQSTTAMGTSTPPHRGAQFKGRIPSGGPELSSSSRMISEATESTSSTSPSGRSIPAMLATLSSTSYVIGSVVSSTNTYTQRDADQVLGPHRCTILGDAPVRNA